MRERVSAPRGPQVARSSPTRPGNHRLPAGLRSVGRTNNEASAPPPADPLGRDPRLARLEAALMLASEPLTARRLAEAAELRDADEARKLLELLKHYYEMDHTAFQVMELAGGYQLLTLAEYHVWLYRMRRTQGEVRFTGAALETLAVIAYKQPITRADIEKIRGVSCAEVLRLLMEKGMVRVAGREDSLGRPQVYGTTKKFLSTFGLYSVRELPHVELLKKPV